MITSSRTPVLKERTAVDNTPGKKQLVERAIEAYIDDFDKNNLRDGVSLRNETVKWTAAATFAMNWDVDADDFAVVLRHNAEVGVDDGFLDDLEHGFVPRFDGDGACIGGVDGCHVVEGNHRAVTVDTDVVEQLEVGFSGTDARQGVFEVHDGFFEPFFSLV